MILKWTVNKSFWVGLLLVLVVLIISICSAKAEELPAGAMCYYTFDEPEAKRIVALYEQLNQCRGLATSEGFLAEEFDNKVKLLEESQQMLNEALTNCEKANGNLKSIIEITNAESKLRMAQCLQDIEAASPKFKDKFTWYGSGVVSGLLLFLLLGL